MCGICGKLSWGDPPEREVIERMTERLAHRGPDGGGVFADGPIAFGHRRLGVIEPSPASAQPMSDSSGRCVVVHNGEIYNYLELRAELEHAGVAFRTASDTEVILEAYKQWGEVAVERFNGMFAFALWDRERQRLFIARDRLGEKPLFFHRRPDHGVVFASGLRALCCDPEVSRRLDRGAVASYLALGYVPSPGSILAAVQKLEPATMLVIERGGEWRFTTYWDLAASFRAERANRRFEDAAAEVSALLDDSVRLRLRADRPVGAFLSGGLDSAGVLASMGAARAAGSTPPRAFCAGFAETSYDESPRAAATARHLGAPLTLVRVNSSALDDLEAVVDAADEPFADGSMIPLFQLAREARSVVTVVLTGDGADELFAGYPTHLADLAHRFTGLIPGRAGAWLLRVRDALGRASWRKVGADYAARRLLSATGLSARRAHVHWRSLFSAAEAAALVPGVAAEVETTLVDRHFAVHYDAVSDCSELNQHLYVDLKTWLADDILVKVDRCSMAHGLEVRTPYLDHRLVELAAALPGPWKRRAWRGKRVLRRALARTGRLPAAAWRAPKAGFNAPLAPWLDSTLGRRVERELLSTSCATGMVEPAVVTALLDDHRQRRRDNGFRLLAALNLELWMRRFNAA